MESKLLIKDCALKWYLIRIVTHNIPMTIPVQVEDDQHCYAVKAVHQELWSEVVLNTHSYTQHTNGYSYTSGI